MPELKALIIDTPHIDNILSGKKTWEMRSTPTKQRGLIGLIRKGSGLVVGIAEIVESKGPLARDDMLANLTRHLISRERIESGAVAKWKHAWVMSAARALARPVSYAHPAGAVIWVRLDPHVASLVLSAAR
jgi:hypothetical protein